MVDHTNEEHMWLPFDELVFVLKQGEKTGPFTIHQIFDLLEKGELGCEDICLREGAEECQRLRDILDWEPEEQEEDEAEVDPTSPDQATPRQASGKYLYFGYPSILSFPIPLFLIIGGVVGGIWLSSAGEWLTLAGFLIALLSFGYISFQRSMNHYFISQRRVEVSTGLIAKSSKEALIEDIRAINVVRRGPAGMIGVGTVEFNTTGDEPEVVFDNVWAADRVKALVRRIQDAEK